MRYPFEKEIKVRLKKNQSKEEIYSSLVTETNRDDLLHTLSNLPNEGWRKKLLPVSLFVIILLILLTTKQFLFVWLHESSSISLVLGLIGPFIHIYILRELLLGHRLGYMVLPLLSILALFRPENRIVPDMYMYMCMAVLSGLLYLFLFPKDDRIQNST
ncbi:MAG: hypothetical protein ABFR63_09175 [Thermodesulfobacteriota bacterium]